MFCRCRFGASLPFGAADVDELVTDPFEKILLPVQERQPARLLFLDDRYLDAIDHRQPPPAEASQQSLAFRVVRVRLGVVKALSVSRIFFQHDLRRAPPLDQTKRAGSHRLAHDLIRVRLDHFARYCAEQVTSCEGMQKARLRFLELELKRVLIERAQPFDRSVIVERLLRLQRLLAHCRHADNLVLFERRIVRRFPARIKIALE